MEYLFTYNFVSACSKNNLYLTLIIYAYLPNVTSSPTDYSGGGWDRLVSGGRCQEWAHFFVIFLFSFNIFFTFLTPHLSNLRLYNPFTGFGGSRNDNARVTTSFLPERLAFCLEIHSNYTCVQSY